MFSATPCTSDLWLMSGESIFSATGKPSCVAIIIASLALRARIVCVTGMWNDDSSVFDSISVSTLRRSASTLSMTRRAAFDVGLGQRGQRRRRLLQQLLVPVEGGDVAEGADGRLGRAKARVSRLR